MEGIYTEICPCGGDLVPSGFLEVALRAYNSRSIAFCRNINRKDLVLKELD